MGAEPTIRRATVADLPTLIELRLALFRTMRGSDDAFDDEALAAALGDYFATELPAGRFHAWLACDPAGVAIGCGGLVFVQKPPSSGNHSGREAYLMNMYTIPAWRGRGVAGLLLRQILPFVRDSGAGAVRLHATAQGQSIYERAGFEPIGTEMVLAIK